MEARIYINGPIGSPPDGFYEESGTTLVDVRRQFESFDGATSARVFIDSEGGDVREGFAIHDYLQALGIPVTTIGMGKVWSIATVIFLAGSERLLAENATFFVHNPLAGIFGNASDMKEVAGYLESVGSDIAEFYAAKTGQSVSLLSDMMEAETELKAQDAINMNFATGILQSVKAVAWISNHNQMSTETKKATGILAKISALLQNEAVDDSPKKEEVETKEPEQEGPSELELLQKENEELKAKLGEQESGIKEIEAVVAKQNEALEVMMKKFEEMEAEPVVEVKTPIPIPSKAKTDKKSAIQISNRLQAHFSKIDELVSHQKGN